MFHKRKSNKMNPTTINNYNKFLSTLDLNSNKISNINNINNINNTINNNNVNINNKEKIKVEIDKIIEIINSDFKNKDYSSTNFTGLKPTDYFLSDFIDPNYYKEIVEKPNIIFNEKSIFNQDYIKPDICAEKEVEIKEYINIDVEINNINDILNLITKYQIDPTIKYNINIKILHEIKEPLQELNSMIGMNDLKNNIVEQILYFIQELHKGKSSCNDFMHTVIYGPPGTGKTEIAKIMGKIYSKIGVLTKGTFKKVTRSDLIAGYLGQTALKTRDVIKESIGGVLFIDEAYSLGNSEKRDSFAKECIDTLCEALSDNKENLMVIIAGYEKELKDCFFNYNQGLDSRFTWRFKTDDYNYEDLYNIFIKKVNDIGWEIDSNSNINSNWFKKNKDYFKFYGRDIETVLAKTKIAHSKRVFCKSENEKKKITLKDLDKGFEIYIKNSEIKNLKEKLEMEKYLYNTLYS